MIGRERAFHAALMCAAAMLLGALARQPAYAQPVADPERAAALADQAEAARRDSRPDAAIQLYSDALAARPEWAEGWWRLGTLYYELDKHVDAATAFERSASLEPSVGTTWVMLGLSEYQLGRFDEALAHIRQGRALGVSADPQFRQVMLYHEGLLLLGKAEFEQAQETLATLSAEGVESDDLTLAVGLSVLRIRPSELKDGESPERQAVLRAGRAEHLAARKQPDAALAAYEQLARDFRAMRNVQYALGRHFVSRQEPDRALAAYQREIEVTPQHVPARLGIAAIKADTDPAAALRYAEEAVAINPRIPLGRYLLGSLLLHTDAVERAIAELEAAEQSVKDDPGVYYALGRAYARAGRTQQAEAARATFRRLTEERQRAARRDSAETPP